MNRVTIPASGVEFVDGGDTIWVHGTDGSTILRIKALGGIVTRACGTGPSHGDIMIEGPVHICIGEGAQYG